MQGKRKYIYMYFWGLVNIHGSVGERKNNEKNARRTVVFGKRRRGEKKKKKGGEENRKRIRVWSLFRVILL